MKSLIIRSASERDQAAVLDIYNDAVLNSTATFDTEPRTMEAQRLWFHETSAHPFAVLVAELNGDVVAWGCLHRFGGKPAYRFTTEDSVYVASNSRRSGIGKRLLAALLATATDNGFHSVIARITGGNPASLGLHERLGFRRVGIEREVGFKFGGWLDVIVMQRILPPKESDAT